MKKTDLRRLTDRMDELAEPPTSTAAKAPDGRGREVGREGDPSGS